MKFQECFNKFYDEMAYRSRNFGGMKEETVQAMAAAWNVRAFMDSIGENKLDDLVTISQDNNIISLPLPIMEEKKQDNVNEEKAIPKKGKSTKPTDEGSTDSE